MKSRLKFIGLALLGGYIVSRTKLIEKITSLPEKLKEFTNHQQSKSTPYEERTKKELYSRAQELEIEGRSTMNKDELISALRAY